MGRNSRSSYIINLPDNNFFLLQFYGFHKFPPSIKPLAFLLQHCSLYPSSHCVVVVVVCRLDSASESEREGEKERETPEVLILNGGSAVLCCKT